MNGSPRIAAYWAPDASHPLWKAGCDWLGRDAQSGWTAGTARDHVAEPRRYGFHATLKAPMKLRDGAAVQDAVDAVAHLAGRHPSFSMPLLEVSTLRGFIALRPAVRIDASHPLRRLSDACVVELDGLRRPPTAEDLARREQSMDFDAAQRANIAAYGYAFVLDQWRFHMTLSDSFPAHGLATRDHMLAEARRHFADALAVPLRCTGVSVFIEPSPGSPFELLQRLPLAT